MSKFYVVPDTNILLHFEAWQDYPWQKHPDLQGHEVIVVFVKPVIEELDRLKDGPKDSFRKRCRAVLSFIEKNRNGDGRVPQRVSEGLYWCMQMYAPSAAGAFSNDERIVKFAAELPGDPKFLLSNDYTPRILAGYAGLRGLEPVGTRLTSPEETELAKARKELDAYKNRLPKLDVRVQDGAQEVRFSPLELFESKIVFVQRRLTAFVEPISRAALTGNAMFQVSAGELAAYRSRLEEALSASYQAAMRLVSSPKLKVELCNRGNSSASHVDVKVIAPKGYTVVDLASFRYPALPTSPGSLAIRPSDAEQVKLLSKLVKQGEARTVAAGPELRISRNVATYYLDRLPHDNYAVPLPAVSIQAPDGGALPQFGLSVEILCAEYPGPQKFKIPVRVDAPSQEDEERLVAIWEGLMAHTMTPSEEYDALKRRRSI